MTYVTQHALERFAQRFGGSDTTKSIRKRTNRMLKVMSFGIELKPRDNTMTLLKNRFKPVKYILYRNIVVVHDAEEDRILTVYGYDKTKYHSLKAEANNG